MPRRGLTVVAMTTMPEALTSSPDHNDLILRLAVAAYLCRYTGVSRVHTESDLRLFFAWRTEQHLAPLVTQRAQIKRSSLASSATGRSSPTSWLRSRGTATVWC